MKLPLWRRRSREDELEEEIQNHLQMAIRDRVERGESAEEAESAARREFGNVGLIKETTRGMWGFSALETFWQDLIRRANVIEAPRLHIGGNTDASARHWREYGDLQRCQLRSA